MNVLATYSIKGGVGKTAAAVNLACLAARDGYRTLLWDLDPQGAASFHFRIKARVKGGVDHVFEHKNSLKTLIKETDFSGLELVPADFSYRNMDLSLNDKKNPVRQIRKHLKPLASDYDYVFLDCAPSISLVSENIFHAADILLVPLIPTPLSLRTYKQLLKYFKKNAIEGVEILPFISMIDRRKQLHRETIVALVRQHYQGLKAMVPYSSQVERMGIRQAPLVSYDRHSIPALAFQNLWGEIKSHVRASHRGPGS